MPKNRKKNMPQPAAEEPYIKDFLDMVAPSVIDFKVDHYLCGNTCRCVWALREYPTCTDEQAILRHLGEMDGVTIRIYTRQVTPSEERRIIHNAANKHRMSRSSTEDLQQTVTAEANLQDVVTLVSTMHRNREPLLHCAVFLELTASSYDALKLLQTDVLTELVRSKLNVDRLMLRQQEGFVSVMPAGRNAFGAQFERVLPASSVANLYPFNYSGKTDPHGFYIGKDKYGANILVDFDKRDDDKTSANILILGNSGQGKSYLLKLLLLNFLEAGKSVISLDVEHEQRDMLLDRMRLDCEYYLGDGDRESKYLWEGDESEQIELMKKLWDSFPEDGKPEWLTMEKILSYEERMLCPQNQSMGCIQL